MPLQRIAIAMVLLLILSTALWAQARQAQVVRERNTASLEELIAQGDPGVDFLLIDVRTPAEFSGGHIPEAINVEYQDIGTALEEADREQLVVLYCRSGNRSSRALQTLRRMGFTNVVNWGGIIHWQGETVLPDR